jgi:hypothetical protein
VEEQIDSADREMKKNAKKTLKIVADSFRKLISERLARIGRIMVLLLTAHCWLPA